MKAVFDERQVRHDPRFRLENGRIVPNPDRPERTTMLLEGALSAGCVRAGTDDFGIAPIAAIHTPRYLSYLRSIYAERKAAVPDLEEVVPSRFCADRIAHYPTDTEALVGFHNADTSCPISAHSWEAIYWSAQTALTGAELILAGEASVYSLCRPSGHHAYRETSGGFCFLNNTAIAAQHLRSAGHRPAILDIDVHHGNGTQSLFYERDDILTVSIHVDPSGFYPFYAGAANECGVGQGLGFNLNIPLERGANMAAYVAALEYALRYIADFGATVIVTALGLDTHEQDPFRGMNVTTEGFQTVGRMIQGVGVPVLNVQEGGYMQDCLGQNLASYLAGVSG